MTETRVPQTAQQTQPWRNWQRFVAIGDSLSEGLWDFHPDEVPADGSEPPLIGWADRYAGALAAKRETVGAGQTHYANLAIRGRKLLEIISEQLPLALEMDAQLVGFIAGANDFLRPRFDLEKKVAELEAAIKQLRSRNIDVILATHGDSKGSPLVNLTRTRALEWSMAQWALAREYGCYVLDGWTIPYLRYREVWAADHLHPNELGHRALAAEVAYATGISADNPRFWRPQPDWTPLSFKRDEDVRWLKEDVLPWIGRRVRGTSSGANRKPKIAELQLVAPNAGAIAYRHHLEESSRQGDPDNAGEDAGN